MTTARSGVVGMIVAGSMAIGSIGVALGQSPSPSAEASTAPGTAITSELGIEQIAQAKTANDKLQGKQYLSFEDEDGVSTCPNRNSRIHAPTPGKHRSKRSRPPPREGPDS